jgi:hypothetical protein
MNQRIHRALDGELAREDLTPSERAQAARVDAAAESLRAALDARAPRDTDAVVMRRIRELGLEPLPARARPVAVRVARSVWSPREIRLRLRPVWGLAAAAVLALVIVQQTTSTEPARPIAAEPALGAETVFVQFRLDVGAAREVALAASFSDWQPTHALHETAPGVWTTVLSVSPGVHDYVFVVDGQEFVPDPIAPQVSDGFGGMNSRLTVLPPSRGL